MISGRDFEDDVINSDSVDFGDDTGVLGSCDSDSRSDLQGVAGGGNDFPWVILVGGSVSVWVFHRNAKRIVSCSSC